MQLKCTDCDTQLKIPDSLAGKAVKCPKCSAVVRVPAAEAETATIVEEAAPAPSPSPAPSPAPASAETTPDPLAAPVAAPDPLAAIPDPLAAPVSAAPVATAAATSAAPVAAMRICPHCEAKISTTVKKCRYCGEFVPKLAAPKKPAEPEKVTPVDIAVSVLLPPVGLGLGILSLTRGSVAKAGAMCAISGILTLGIMGGVIYKVFSDALGGSSRPIAQGNTVIAPAEDEDYSDWEQPNLGGEPMGGGEEDRLNRPPSAEDLAAQPPAIQQAMRANVRIISRGPMGSGVGSGVVIKREGDVVHILTNRHVLDPAYSLTEGRGGYEIDQIQTPEVMYVNGDEEPGKILWFAPNGVDLAIIRAFCSTEDVAVANCADDPTVTIGENVFAVGNPRGIGWSLTKGTVSGLRSSGSGEKAVPVIQTDADINPGNSGGGLYNEGGQLVGINDFIIDQAQGMGFAIRYPLFRELFQENPPE